MRVPYNEILRALSTAPAELCFVLTTGPRPHKFYVVKFLRANYVLVSSG